MTWRAHILWQLIERYFEAGKPRIARLLITRSSLSESEKEQLSIEADRFVLFAGCPYPD